MAVPAVALRVGWCQRGDSNPYGISPTATSRLRVCQFHHPGTYISMFFSIAINEGLSTKIPRYFISRGIKSIEIMSSYPSTSSGRTDSEYFFLIHSS